MRRDTPLSLYSVLTSRPNKVASAYKSTAVLSSSNPFEPTLKRLCQQHYTLNDLMQYEKHPPTLKMSTNVETLWFALDYTSWTTTELRTFVKDRSALDTKGNGNLKKRLAKLVSLLAFARWTERPHSHDFWTSRQRSALRCIDTLRDSKAKGNDLATSLLLTSKLVHVEVEPILYSGNDFSIRLSTRQKGRLTTEIVASGTKNGFWYGHILSLSKWALASEKFTLYSMLHNIMNLTIHLSLTSL